MFAVRSFLAVCIAIVGTPALALSNKGMGAGGALGPYEMMIGQANASSEPFRIHGKCNSACTMFLSIRNVCIERNAVFGFHAGKTPGVTARMAQTYNSALRSYVDQNHFLETEQLHFIPASTMISRFGYKAC
jgi:hypothetical protein